MSRLLACDYMIAIDVETHDLVPQGRFSVWTPVKFGLRTLVTGGVLSSLRIIQLGWAADTISRDDGGRRYS